MSFIKFIVRTFFFAFLSVNTHASQITINTLYEVNLEDQEAAAFTYESLPISLTLSVIDLENPTNPPLWTWTIPDMTTVGVESRYNQTVSHLVDAPVIPPLGIGQLTFQAVFKNHTPPISGAYMCGTTNPLSTIDFSFLVINTKDNFLWDGLSLSLVGNPSELPDPLYTFRTLNTFYTTAQEYQTFPALNKQAALNDPTISQAYEHMDGSEYNPKKTYKSDSNASLAETVINSPSYPFVVEVTFPSFMMEQLLNIWPSKAPFNLTQLPVIFTISNPQSLDEPLFNQTIIMGRSPTTTQFIWGEKMIYNYSLNEPIPSLSPNTLSANILDGTLVETFPSGTNTPLKGIGFTWTKQYLPVVYPITESDPNPATVIGYMPKETWVPPLNLKTLMSPKVSIKTVSDLSLAESREVNLRALKFNLANHFTPPSPKAPEVQQTALAVEPKEQSNQENVQLAAPENISKNPENPLPPQGEDPQQPEPKPDGTAFMGGLYSFVGHLVSTAENWLDDASEN